MDIKQSLLYLQERKQKKIKPIDKIFKPTKNREKKSALLFY